MSNPIPIGGPGGGRRIRTLLLVTVVGLAAAYSEMWASAVGAAAAVYAVVGGNVDRRR